MDEKEQYINTVNMVLEGLKNECKQYECCLTKCVFYIKSTSECLLKQCPCDYDLTEINKAISKLKGSV